MELRFPWLPQALQHTSQSWGRQVLQKEHGLPPTHHLAAMPPFTQHPARQGSCWDLQAPLSAWGAGGGIRLLPAWPAPVANPQPCNWSWLGRGLQNDRWNFCSPPAPHTLDMPFPSQNKESLTPQCPPNLMDDGPTLPVRAGPGRWASVAYCYLPRDPQPLLWLQS